MERTHHVSPLVGSVSTQQSLSSVYSAINISDFPRCTRTWMKALKHIVILHSADEEKKLCWAEVCAIVFSQERTQEDPGEGPGEPGPPYFRPKWGPKGRKQFFLRVPPPPHLRVWMTAPSLPPLIWRSESATGEWFSLFIVTFTRETRVLQDSVHLLPL